MPDIVRTWFAKGSSGSVGKRSSKYFIENNCVSCGWSLDGIAVRNEINNSLERYKEIWGKEYGESRNWGYQGVKQLFDNLKKGDYIWTRHEGVYYLAKVEDKPENLFSFDSSQNALDYDCSAHLKNIKWKKIGTEEAVPGSVSTYSRNRKALIRIDNHNEIIDKMTLLSIFSANQLGDKIDFSINSKKEIFKYLDPNNIEDLCALWLFKKYGYIVIPSTNKLSTEKYEFVLVDPESCDQKLIYVQVKNGRTEIDPYKYKELLTNELDELWIFTPRGSIKNINSNDRSRIHIGRYKLGSSGFILKRKYEIDELIDFVKNKENRNIIPRKILHWIDKIY